MTVGLTQPVILEFFRALKKAPRGLLMLDYDGTLAPFHQDRMEAEPYAGVRASLERILGSSRTKVVIVSGRKCDEILKLAGLRHPVEVWGCHGWEHSSGEGKLEMVGLSPETLASIKEAAAQAGRIISHEQVEEKTGCVAAHWRGEDRSRALEIENSLRVAWARLAANRSVEIRRFDGGLEFLASDRTKGTVIRDMLAHPTSRDAAVAFLGDDLTDEDAFRALGTRGLSVLIRNEPRRTSAHVRLSPPQELVAFLERWHEATQGGSQ